MANSQWDRDDIRHGLHPARIVGFIIPKVEIWVGRCESVVYFLVAEHSVSMDGDPTGLGLHRFR